MKLKIIYGISDLQDAVKKQIEDAIIAKGGEIEASISRWNKVAVLHMVDEIRGDNKDNVILIISHRLDNEDPFSLLDLISCQEAIPLIKVILIIDREEQGSSFLKDLYNNGFYHALYAEDTDDAMIAELAINGRSATETRRYYGLNGEGMTRGTLSVEKAVEFVIKAPEEDATYAERLLWIQEKLNNEIMFREVINRLPDEIKEVLSNDPRFETYIAEYLKAKAEEEAERERQKARERELLERERELRRQEERARAARLDARSAINRALRRMVIGVAGTEHRVGCTHHAIHMAHYLSNHGFKVAVAEYEGVDKKILEEIIDSVSDGRMQYKGVDYYPDFSLSSLPDLNIKNYHFVIVDFGVYKEEICEEFGRCVQQIMISGSKPWEVKRIRKIYEILGFKESVLEDMGGFGEDVRSINFDKLDNQLKYIDFLFAPAERKVQGDILKAMVPFEKNVYFTSYVTNPFAGEKIEAFSEIMADYMVDVKRSTPIVKDDMDKAGSNEGMKNIKGKLRGLISDGLSRFKD